MPNTAGKIKATAPPAPIAPGAAPPQPASADTSLPDATKYAKLTLAGLFVIAFALAAVLNWRGWTTHPFVPSSATQANFTLFVGFYVAAQVIERLLEFVSPLLPPDWLPSDIKNDTAQKAAHIKADRAAVVLGLAGVIGVATSCGLGLFLLRAIGLETSGTIDAFATGVTLAAGTKPLHDFITLIQKQNTPTTGTSA